jgi:hypothetical protein
MKRAKSLAVFQLAGLSFSRIVLTASLAKAVTAAMAIWQRMVVQFMMNLLLKMIGKGGNIPGQQINDESMNDAMICDGFQYLASLPVVWRTMFRCREGMVWVLEWLLEFLNARQACCTVGYDWMGWIVRRLLVAFNIGKFAAGLNGAVSLQ